MAILASGVCNNLVKVIGAELQPQIFEQVLRSELLSHLNILGNISDSETYLKRSYLDPAHKRAALTLQGWMREACLSTWIDGVGNVRGRIPGKHGEPALLIGSHYDTVIDGGIYDGALGVLVGIAAVKAAILKFAVQDGIISTEVLNSMVGENDIDCSNISSHFGDGKAPRLPRPIEIIAFADEEGVRFQSTFLGSRALAGTLSKDMLVNTKDEEGKSLVEVILGENLATTVDDILTGAPKNAYSGYLEVHIEQGPILEKEGKSLGIVSGIAGQSRYQASIWGEQGHAGTVPLKLRKDPMPASATLIHSLETLCRSVAINNASLNELSNKYSMKDVSALQVDASLVCTVGSLQTWPGASNVIPQNVNFTLDIRSLSDSSRNGVIKVMRAIMDDECSRRNLTCGLYKKHEASAITMDSKLTEKLVHSVEMAEGETTKNGPRNTCSNAEIVRIPSGAGHDALAISKITPVSMLFVRCRKGISHSPDEWVDPKDVEMSSVATFYFILDWANSHW